METFKKPLSEEKETYYVKLYATGNEEESDYAKKKLIEHNLRLVAHVAKKYQCKELELDELISVGTIGLIKAIHTFNHRKGSKLSTYAARCIENEILMVFRANKKNIGTLSLYEPIGFDKEGNEITFLDISQSNDEDMLTAITRQEDLSRLKDVLQQENILTSQEQKILDLRYGLKNDKELTQREVGKMLGISRSYVSRIEKKALLKLRERIQ